MCVCGRETEIEKNVMMHERTTTSIIERKRVQSYHVAEMRKRGAGIESQSSIVVSHSKLERISRTTAAVAEIVWWWLLSLNFRASGDKP